MVGTVTARPTAEPAAARLAAVALLAGRKLGGALLVIWGVVTFTFLVVRVVAPDPIGLLVPPGAGTEVRDAVRTELGLDGSIVSQYGIYLGHLARGDLGTSFGTNQPVSDDLLDRFPATLELAVPALIIGVALGTGLGIVAALRRGRLADHAIRVVTVAALAMPPFWLGLMLLSLFFVSLGILPGPIGRLPAGVDPPPTMTGSYVLDALLAGDTQTAGLAAAQLVLPVAVLACGIFAPITRVARSGMVEALRSDYVRTATAYGFPHRRVLTAHALRNALLPVITMIANGVAFAFTGAVLVEGVFGWPGIGQYALVAVQQSDFPALQGFVLYAAVVYVVLYALVDLAYAAADPRTRS
ncbi:ABC transporter permease [Dactylosporangium siamense]|uniref:ABC transporter permease n=1 Tax=Dactylosporangium siamense TaxID=685454 RepID=A0A919UJH0_9ACTN|nr:ABC transporter permease [Dactylosporangium siamense]GIG52693.1 ABC transporter permease [Dactylosporangium siamense]